MPLEYFALVGFGYERDGNTSKLVGYVTRSDGSLEEISSVKIRYKRAYCDFDSAGG
jgi:hypothetical protein